MRGSGTSPHRDPLKKIAWSWIGSFLGIYIVSALGRFQFGLTGSSLFLIGSFGASAVLVYGRPLTEFSQPRNLVGGHVLSATIGVSVFFLFGENTLLAAPAAVSFAITAMQITRTLHPPGGATALIAVIGGDSVHSLGFRYVLCPVLLGALVILAIALLVNNLSRNPRRHYPQYWI